MPTVTNVSFPYNKNRFHVTLYERGNAPDYSYVYAQECKRLGVSPKGMI